MKEKPSNYRQAKEKTKLNKRLATRPNYVVQDGEIFADSFLNKLWFKDLAEKIYHEIKRLKVCTIRQLIESKFKDVDRYYFATALESLGNRLKTQQRGLFTEYSINPESVAVTVENKNWRDMSLPKTEKQITPYFEKKRKLY